jgi:hypothetical protein
MLVHWPLANTRTDSLCKASATGPLAVWMIASGTAAGWSRSSGSSQELATDSVHHEFVTVPVAAS